MGDSIRVSFWSDESNNVRKIWKMLFLIFLPCYFKSAGFSFNKFDEASKFICSCWLAFSAYLCALNFKGKTFN
jgi:hypothetical protein